MLEKFNKLDLGEAAGEYSRMGFTITPCLPRTKKAYLKGWNTREVCESFEPEKHWREHPDDNIGLVLEPSKCLTLDLDNIDEFRICMKAIGLTPEEENQTPFWLSSSAGIKSGKPNRGKLLFKAPGDLTFEHQDLSWVNVGDTKKNHSVFELRAGWEMDILPPSIHPDTMKPYQWVGGDLLPAPRDLILLWSNWSMFELDMKKADRNYREDTPTEVKRGRPQKPYTGRDYIGEWNSRNDVGKILEEYGYQRKGTRYTSPASNRKDTSVTVSSDKLRFYCFDTNDYFSDKHSHTAFDLICHYDHNDNFLEALSRVKDDLGVNKIQDKELVESIKRYANFRGV